MLAALRGLGRADQTEVRLNDGDVPLRATGTTLRHDNGLVFLLRLAPASPHGQPSDIPEGQRNLLRLAENGPDALVVTDADGTILTANAAFLDMAQLTSEDQLRGEALDRWLGRQGLEAEVLLSNLRGRGSVGSMPRPCVARWAPRGMSRSPPSRSWMAANGASASRSATSAPGCGRRRAARPCPAARCSELTELIGRVPLKELVREAADAIERLCIEAALEITGDNRASAAEMLGPQPPEPLREAAPLRPRRSRCRAERAGIETAWRARHRRRPRLHRSARPGLARPRCWSFSSRSPGSRRCGPSPAAWSPRAPHFAQAWPLALLGIVLAGPVVCGMSQAVNDWFDRHVDAVNEPQRPIPSGRLPGRTGLWVAIGWTGLSIARGLACSAPGALPGRCSGVALAWAYSAPPLRLKRDGWTGSAACAPVL